MADSNLPDFVYGPLLPKSSLNVFDFLTFPIPPEEKAPKIIHQENLFLAEPSIVDDAAKALVLRQIPMPKKMDVDLLKCQSTQVEELGCGSFACPIKGGSTIKLPFWVFDFWAQAHAVKDGQETWKDAYEWMRHQEGQYGAGITALRRLPWNAQLTNFGGDSSLTLAGYCIPQNWLNSTHVDQQLTILRTQMLGNQDVTIIDTHIVTKLIQVYRSGMDPGLEKKSTGHLRNLAQKLVGNPVARLGMVLTVHLSSGSAQLPSEAHQSNHWVAAVISMDAQKVYYGDSLHNPPPGELVDVINWWLGLVDNTKTPFEFDTLACTLQSDGDSCSILAINSLSHYFIPTVIALLPDDDPVACRNARIHAMVEVCDQAKFNEAVTISPRLQSMTNTSIPTPPSLTLPASKPFLPVPGNMTKYRQSVLAGGKAGNEPEKDVEQKSKQPVPKIKKGSKPKNITKSHQPNVKAEPPPQTEPVDLRSAIPTRKRKRDIENDDEEPSENEIVQNLNRADWLI
ncbi:hypothetical protein BDN72DRAFT_907092 [Pluteus cervinus]|uniref:Uncharacterized protein n=1 Tax=Pluteus cervinus TaxID=181527 RepID=A0ACD2ZXH7_9AGAR|nr:hypothetical protein BDN72DRAFT_907092 [Pluteus cervinus]